MESCSHKTQPILPYQDPSEVKVPVNLEYRISIPQYHFPISSRGHTICEEAQDADCRSWPVTVTPTTSYTFHPLFEQHNDNKSSSCIVRRQWRCLPHLLSHRAPTIVASPRIGWYTALVPFLFFDLAQSLMR